MTWASIVTILKFLAALLGFGRQVADDVQSSHDRQAGRDQVEKAQAAEGERVEGEIAAEAAKPVSEDDAIARLKDGKG